MSEYAEQARAIGMDEAEAALREACCRAEAHYAALKQAGADDELVERARHVWDGAAWQYAQYQGVGDG